MENKAISLKLLIINSNEKLVFPGFVDCHTHLGISEECTGKIGADNNETSDPVNPHLNGIDGINPLDIKSKVEITIIDSEIVFKRE